jgi:membrane dipeptidase
MQTKFLLALLSLTALLVGCRMHGGSANRDYREFHRKAIVGDLHSDTPLRLRDGFDFSRRDTTGHMDLPRLKEGGVDLQVFACWLPTNTPKEKCRATVDLLIDSLEANIKRHPDTIAICTTAKQARTLISAGKIAAFIGIENGVAIADTLANLKHFYDRGVRYMTLTHTASSDWCISSADTAPAFHGLTEFGRSVVREMNRLGMIIDVSHASKEAIEEVLKITTAPVIASHSCVYVICPHNRNLTDDQIKAIAKNGGVIGVNFWNAYLSADVRRIEDSIIGPHKRELDSIDALYRDDPKALDKATAPYYAPADSAEKLLNISVETLVDHIDYIVKLVGPDYVALGSDYDGIPSVPIGVEDCSKLPNITKELVRRGYSEKVIAKVLGGNFMRVFGKVCKG